MQKEVADDPPHPQGENFLTKRFEPYNYGENLFAYFVRTQAHKPGKLKEIIKEKFTTMGVVSALILTITFPAALAPPVSLTDETGLAWFVGLMAMSTCLNLLSICAAVWIFDFINVVLITDNHVREFAAHHNVTIDLSQNLQISGAIVAIIGFLVGIQANLSSNTEIVVILSIFCFVTFAGFIALFRAAVAAFRIISKVDNVNA